MQGNRKTGPTPIPRALARGNKRSFARVCEEHGYDPGDAVVLFRKLAGSKAMEYMECAQRDEQHPDFPNKSGRELRELAIVELAGLMKWDMELLPYVYGRPHQTTDANVNVFQPTLPKEDLEL